MSKTVKPIHAAQLTLALQKSLRLYHQDIMEELEAAGETAVKKLVKITRATAPEDTGDYKTDIDWKRETRKLVFDKFIWYVGGPNCRLTHLLVHGHATRNGGRVPGNPFLHNALDEVLPEYEKAVEEALKK